MSQKQRDLVLPRSINDILYFFFQQILYVHILNVQLYFSLPACQCDIDGSIGITCDDDGKCKCKPNVIGAKCNECEDGYYDHPHCMGK